MTLTRTELERDVTRRALRESVLAPHLLTDEALAASLDETLSQRDPAAPIWIFGYGSLIWNPQLTYDHSAPAHLHGYHRRLCLWSRVNRGTPENPGLVLGLERGGSCHGMAYRLATDDVRAELILLWRREMLLGSYLPRWVKLSTHCGSEIRALTFVINPEANGYTGKLSDDDVLRALRTACGRYGSCAEYVCNTLSSLRKHGIDDAYLARLCAQLPMQA